MALFSVIDCLVGHIIGRRAVRVLSISVESNRLKHRRRVSKVSRLLLPLVFTELRIGHETRDYDQRKIPRTDGES